MMTCAYEQRVFAGKHVLDFSVVAMGYIGHRTRVYRSEGKVTHLPIYLNDTDSSAVMGF